MANAAAKFGERLTALDDEFGEIAVFAIHRTQIFYERKFFSRRNEDSLELLNRALDIKDAIFGRAGEARASFAEELGDTEAIGVR